MSNQIWVILTHDIRLLIILTHLIKWVKPFNPNMIISCWVHIEVVLALIVSKVRCYNCCMKLYKTKQIHYNQLHYSMKGETGKGKKHCSLSSSLRPNGKKEIWLADQKYTAKITVVTVRFIYRPIGLLRSHCYITWAWEKLNLSRSNTHATEYMKLATSPKSNT